MPQLLPLAAMQDVSLTVQVLGQCDWVGLKLCTGKHTPQRGEELHKVPDTTQLTSGLDGTGALGTHVQNGLVRCHSGSVGQEAR